VRESEKRPILPGDLAKGFSGPTYKCVPEPHCCSARHFPFIELIVLLPKHQPSGPVCFFHPADSNGRHLVVP
jgi:hypothetical protein